MNEGALLCSLNNDLVVFDLADESLANPVNTFRSADCCRQHAVCCVDSFVLVANEKKTQIAFYSTNSAQPIFRCAMPELMTCISMTKNSRFLIGCGISGSLYFWDIKTGELLRICEGHFTAARCIAVTEDSSLFSTGGEDGTVLVWSLSTVLSNAPSLPFLSLSEHMLPITALVFGVGIGDSQRLYSSSLDSSVKVIDIATGKVITSITFPSPIHSLAVHPLDEYLFAGSSNGRIYSLNMSFSRPAIMPQEIIAIGISENDAFPSIVFEGHSSAVLGLCLSFGGTLLASMTKDAVFLWRISSKTVIKRIESKTPHFHVSIQNTSLIRNESSFLSSSAKTSDSIEVLNVRSKPKKSKRIVIKPLKKYPMPEKSLVEFTCDVTLGKTDTDGSIFDDFYSEFDDIARALTLELSPNLPNNASNDMKKWTEATKQLYL